MERRFLLKTKRMKGLLLSLLLPANLLLSQPSPAPGLPRSSPEQQGISSAALLAFVERADREIQTMNSVMLVRHGHVVAEGWWAPYDAETPHLLYSLSKSFTSTAVGLAVADGKLSIHDRVLDFFPDDAPPEPSAHLEAMRVHDLLRMSTGHEIEPRPVPDEPWTRTFLAAPVPHLPGTHFLYNTSATYMLSAIVQKATGETVLDYLRPRLFEPLGIDRPVWGTSPQGVTLGGYGLRVRTEDIARFGQLYLQKGQWNGRELVPASWAEAATALQTSNGSNPDSDWNQGYGYQFWRTRFGTVRGDGAFGQYCLLFPEHDAVLAITSGVRDMQAVLDLVFETLLPALMDAPLPEDPDAWRRLTDRLGDLRVPVVEGAPQSVLAQAVSGRTYVFPENERGLEAIRFDFSGDVPDVWIRSASGEERLPIGSAAWIRTRAKFADGLDRMLDMPADPLVGTSGAWTAEDVFTMRICLYETPFFTTIDFRFDGQGLVVESEHNVSFIPRALPRLVGYVR